MAVEINGVSVEYDIGKPDLVVSMSGVSVEYDIGKPDLVVSMSGLSIEYLPKIGYAVIIRR